MGTGYHDLRSLGGVLYLKDVNLDSLGGAEYLAFYHLVLIEDRIYLT